MDTFSRWLPSKLSLGPGARQLATFTGAPPRNATQANASQRKPTQPDASQRNLGQCRLCARRRARNTSAPAPRRPLLALPARAGAAPEPELGGCSLRRRARGPRAAKDAARRQPARRAELILRRAAAGRAASHVTAARLAAPTAPVIYTSGRLAPAPRPTGHRAHNLLIHFRPWAPLARAAHCRRVPLRFVGARCSWGA